MPEPTAYAPAERGSREDLLALAASVRRECALIDLLHLVPDMVMVLDPNRQIVYANRAVLTPAGAGSLDAVVGRRPGEVWNCRHAAETPGGCGTTAACEYCGAVNGVLASQAGQPAVEECRIATVVEAREEALDLRIWANPVVFGGQSCTFIAAVNIADEKRRVFLERVFLHDILNTATALRGFSRLLGADAVTEEDRGEFLDRIGALSDRIVDEIEGHRQLVAAESGSLEVQRRRVHVKQIVDDVFAAYNRPDMLNRRVLRIAGDCADVAIDSDPVLLGRIVGNMAKNAIEASSPGDTVTIGCRAVGGGVQLWVHNPASMPSHVRTQVFKRSFSTKGAGRGVGTYSMKFLTEQCLGGRIWFSSTEDRGTTFIASYPCPESPALAA
jgi:signal transduction histidine kinase